MSAVAWAAIKNAFATWARGTGLPDSRVLFSGQNLGRPDGIDAWISMKWTGTAQIGQDWNDVEERPLEFADKLITAVDALNDVVVVIAHGLALGDGPVQVVTDGTLPAGLDLLTDYWVVPIDADTFALAASFVDARAAIVVPISDAGSGTHEIHATADTLGAGAEVTVLARGQRRGVLSVTCFPPAEVTDATEAHAILHELGARTYLPSVYALFEAAGCAVANVSSVQPLDGVLGSTRFEPRAIMTLVVFYPSEIGEPGSVFDYVNIEDTTRGGGLAVDLT